MILPKWYFYIILLTMTTDAAIDINEMYQKRQFCGLQLDNVMAELCSWHPEDEETYRSPRMKRSIVYECCQQPCSKKYILDYYCTNPNKKYVEIFENPVALPTYLVPKDPLSTSSTKDMYDYQNTENQFHSYIKDTPMRKKLKRPNKKSKKARSKRRNLKGKLKCSCKKSRKKAKKRLKKPSFSRKAVVGYKEDDRPIIVIRRVPF